MALVNKTAQYADEIDKTSMKMGIARDALQEYRFAAGQVGLEATALERAVGLLGQQMGQGDKATERFTSAMNRLQVQSENTDDAFMEILTKLHEVEDAQLQAAMAADIFGERTARELMPAIVAGGREIANLRDRAHELGLVMSDENIAANVKFADTMDEVRQTLGAVGRNLTNYFLPTMQIVLDWLLNNLNKIPPVVEFIGDIFGIVFKYIPLMLAPVFDAVMTFLGLLEKPRKWIIDVAGTAWDWLFNTSWEEKWLDIKSWMQTGWEWTVNIAGNVWSWLTNTSWEQKWLDIRSWMQAGWSWAVDIAGNAWSWLEEKAPWLTDTLKSLWNYIKLGWEWLVELPSGAWHWLEENYPWLTSTIETMKSLLGSAWSWIIETSGTAWSWFKDIDWYAKWESIRTWMINFGEWTINIAGTAWAWFTDTSWEEKWLDIRGWIANFGNWSINVIGDAWQWFKDTEWSGNWETIRRWIVAFGDWSIQTVGSAWEWFENVDWSDKWLSIRDWITNFGRWSIETAGDAWQWFKDVDWAETWESIRGWIVDFGTWSIDTAGNAWAWFKDTAWEQKWLGIKGWMSKGWAWLIDLSGDAWNFLTEKAPGMTGALETGWNWTIDILGTTWLWLRDTAFPFINDTASTAWDWTVSFLGDTWEWLRDVAFPFINETASTAWNWTVAILGDAWVWLRDTAFPLINQTVRTFWNWSIKAIGNFYTWLVNEGMPMIGKSLRNIWVWSLIAIGTAWEFIFKGGWRKSVDSFVEGFFNARDDVIRYTRELAEGVAEWFGETKLGSTLNKVGEWTKNVTGWFFDMYDKVVGNSYVPDMVDEIGVAWDRLQARLAETKTYTSEVTTAFEQMQLDIEGVNSRLTDDVEKTTKTIKDRFTEAFESIGKTIETSLVQSIDNVLMRTKDFRTILVDMLSSAVNSLLTAAVGAMGIADLVSKAIANMWNPAGWLVIGGLLVALAGIRSKLSADLNVKGGEGSTGGDFGSGRLPSAGRQVSEITGPSRDLLTDLLSPLASLDSLTGIGNRIYDLLDARLPSTMGAGGGVVFESGAIQIYPATNATGNIVNDTIERIEEALAEKFNFRQRGLGLS